MIWRTDNWGQVAEWMPHQTTTLPKWMFFQKTFLRIILAAKWLVRHSNTSPQQTAAKDFAFSPILLLCAVYSAGVPGWQWPTGAAECWSPPALITSLFILQGCLADSDLLELLNAGPLQHWSLHCIFCRDAWLTVNSWSCWMLVPSSTDHFTLLPLMLKLYLTWSCVQNFHISRKLT